MADLEPNVQERTLVNLGNNITRVKARIADDYDHDVAWEMFNKAEKDTYARGTCEKCGRFISVVMYMDDVDQVAYLDPHSYRQTDEPFGACGGGANVG